MSGAFFSCSRPKRNGLHVAADDDDGRLAIFLTILLHLLHLQQRGRGGRFDQRDLLRGPERKYDARLSADRCHGFERPGRTKQLELDNCRDTGRPTMKEK